MQQLAHAVGAEIGHQQAVARGHAAVTGEHRRGHEFIAFAGRITRLQRRHGIRRRNAFRRADGTIGALDARPAPVAVHRPIAPANRGQRELPCFGDIGFEAAQIGFGRARRGIAPIEKAMQTDLQAGAVEEVDQRRHMVLMGMHAARRQEAHQMAAPAAGAQFFDEAAERRQIGERAVGDGGIDARQILQHRAPGAQIHMADLGIAHLPRRQADIAARGMQQAVRIFFQQCVPHRRARLENRVVGGFAARAPAVEHAQHHRARNPSHHHPLSSHRSLVSFLRPALYFKRDDRGGRTTCWRRAKAARPAWRGPGDAATPWRRTRASDRRASTPPRHARRRRR